MEAQAEALLGRMLRRNKRGKHGKHQHSHGSGSSSALGAWAPPPLGIFTDAAVRYAVINVTSNGTVGSMDWYASRALDARRTDLYLPDGLGFIGTLEVCAASISYTLLGANATDYTCSTSAASCDVPAMDWTVFQYDHLITFNGFPAALWHNASAPDNDPGYLITSADDMNIPWMLAAPATTPDLLMTVDVSVPSRQRRPQIYCFLCSVGSSR
jgi:hypothetical protein